MVGLVEEIGMEVEVVLEVVLLEVVVLEVVLEVVVLEVVVVLIGGGGVGGVRGGGVNVIVIVRQTTSRGTSPRIQRLFIGGRNTYVVQVIVDYRDCGTSGSDVR